MLRTEVAVAVGDPFVRGEVVGTDRAAGMQFIGADANHRTHAIVAAEEPGGSVNQHRGGINSSDKTLSQLHILGNDAIRMRRTIGLRPPLGGRVYKF
jgi:hypothetical protein